MAEFCLSCWNKLNDRSDTERDVVLSDELDLCEECGKYCRTVAKMRTYKWLYDIKVQLKKRR